MPERELQGSTGGDRGPGLDSLWLELTRACNWECVHCYAECSPRSPRESSLSVAEWETLITEAAQLDCRILHFIGGEPTLYPAFRHLLDRALTEGFPQVEVNTNASRLSSQLARHMGQHGVGAAVSFYSAIPERHEAVTGRSGSLARVLSGIRLLLDNGVETRVGIVRVDQTDEELAEARALLESLGVEHIGGDRLRRVGRAKTLDGSTPETEGEEMAELCDLCSDSRLCVLSDGQVSACPISRSWPLGDARYGLEVILNGAAARQFRRNHRRTHSELRATLEAVCIPQDPPCRPNWFECRPDGRTKPPPKPCRPNLSCEPDDRGDNCYPCYPAS